MSIRNSIRVPAILAFSAFFLLLFPASAPCPVLEGASTLIDSPFTDIGAGLPAVSNGAAAWGDYDNDGDLDLLLAGAIQPGGPLIARVYRNGGGVYTDIAAGLPGVQTGDAAWGDYDRDGDLDILLTGWVDASTRISRIYRNTGGFFADIGAGLIGLMNTAVDWGDYDNDGDLDIVLAGREGSTYYTRVYRNDASSFADVGAGLPGVGWGAAAWGDCDNDGDLDLVLTGATPTGSIARVYRNDAGVFVSITMPPGFLGVSGGAAIWGDYDGDGDLDLFTSGLVTSYYISRIFTNNGTFFSLTQDLTGVNLGSAAWGDCDDDGDLDLLVAGQDSPSTQVSSLYRNDAGWFADTHAGLPGVGYSSVAWGDQDNDGDLDLLLMGSTAPGVGLCSVYRNNAVVANTPPAAPTGLHVQAVGSSATFAWDAASDGQTPSAGLTYNLRVGTTPGGSEIISAMASTATGYRRVPQHGNTNHRTSWTIQLPFPLSTFTWSVQAVDACFLGSPFATEQHVSTGLEPGAVPTRFALHPAVPNPFNPATTIRYDLPEPCAVTLRIYDVAGRGVCVLKDGAREDAGTHEITWRGEDDSGRPVGSGTYFCRLDSGSFTETVRMMVLR